ncbi:MAG TPA: type ISP restriction/modification enzyme, partial [Sphingomicrobium sp.]|nr:type ISP restriction/modification enzyme [Sphingomicrobium sp.]
NLVRAGEKVVRLLDANRDARDIIEAVLSPERAKHLAQLRRADGGTVTAGDLQITVTYWGGGKGRWKPRPFLEDEQAGAGWDAWGEQTGDLYLNDHTYLAHVPEAVWLYQLGGYPVLKKWLGYRQADRRNGSPLSDDERRWLRQMVQRIAALEAMGPSLDALYQDAATDSFTAVDLELRT